MKAKVTASAPGKIIISGEHSVIYGYPAIVASIGLRAVVSIHFTGSNFVLIRSKDLNEEQKYYRNDFFAILNGERMSLLDGIAVVVAYFFEKREVPGLEITIKSDIPTGAGLGSSAAVCVATATALFEMAKQKCDKDAISKLAFFGEKVIHGTPSGLDNTIATFGGLLRFQRSELESYELSDSLPVIIANTKIQRSTRVLVENVAQLKANNNNLFERVFASFELVSEEILGALKTKNYKQVGKLMDINQGLLDAIGVGHRKLSELIWLARDSGALGAKLTGAGGGGCMIALTDDISVSKKIRDKFRELNIDVIQTFITKDGARIE